MRPRLVVLRALKLGDFLTAVPALRALADAFPAHERVLAAPSLLEPLVRHVGAVDRVAPTPDLVPLDRALARPDVAVDLHGRGPASQPLLLDLEPRRLIAFHHPELPATEGLPEWRAREHEVVRWCRLLDECGIPADPRRLDVTPPSVAVGAVPPGATVVHPGAASEARRWPLERFAAVARAEHDAGHHVVVTGTASERPLAVSLAERAGLPHDSVLAGRTDLLQLAAVIGRAGRVVCGDTGVAHLATAFGTPSVVLFGPVPPSEWGPPPDRPHHIALWAGRRGDPHASTVDSGLLEIDVDDVLQALANLDVGQASSSAAL